MFLTRPLVAQKVKPCLTLLDKVSMILIFRKEFINVNTDVVNLWN